MTTFLGLEAEFKSTGAAELASDIRGAGDAARDAVDGVGTLDTSLRGLTETMGPLIKAFLSFETIKKVFEATNDAQESTNRLAQAFRNVGLDVTKYQGAIDGTADHLKKYGFTAAETEAALAKMTVISGDAGASFQNLQLAADLAATMHIGLEEAAKLLGRAMEGNITLLVRQGLVSKGSADVMGELAQRTHGAADAMSNTLGGAARAITGEMTTLAEKLGEAFLGETKLSDGSGAVVRGLKEMEEWVRLNHSAIGGLTEGFGQLISKMQGIGQVIVNETKSPLSWLNQQLREAGALGIGAAGGIGQFASSLFGLGDNFKSVADRLVAQADDMMRRVAALRRNDRVDLLEVMGDLGTTPGKAPPTTDYDPGKAGRQAQMQLLMRRTMSANKVDNSQFGITPGQPLASNFQDQAGGGDAIKAETDALQSLQEHTVSMGLTWKGTTETMKEWSKEIREQAGNYLTAANAIPLLQARVAQLKKEMADPATSSAQKGADARELAQDLGVLGQPDLLEDQFKQTLSIVQRNARVFENTFSQMWATIGKGIQVGMEKAFQTGSLSKGLAALGKTVLEGLGQMFSDQGQVLLTYGLTMLKLIPLLSNPVTSGPAAVAAGLALIALGAAFSGAVSGSSGGGGGSSGIGSITPTSVNASTYLTPTGTEPYAGGTQYPGIVQPIINVVGYDNASVQRGIMMAFNNAVRRGYSPSH